ncbi:MAG: hypothetical protein ACTHJ3_07450 [Pararhizobium sp.]
MEFNDARISFSDFGSERIVTVRVNVRDAVAQYAMISFADPERSDETNAAERERIRKLAKKAMRSAAQAL